MGLIPHIGDDEKLQLAKGFAVINGHERASVEGAKVDLVTRYLELRHQALDHQAALAHLNPLLQEWYPGSPVCWPEAGAPNPTPGPEPEPEPGPTPGPSPGPSPLLNPDRALAARKIPWGTVLDCTGQAFIVKGDGTPRLPVGLHAGDFLGQWCTMPERRGMLMQALDDAYLAGYSWLRCWLNVDPNPWWDNNGIAKSWNPITTPGWDREYDSFLLALEERGMQLHLAAGGLDILPKAKYREMFEWLRQRVAHEPHRYCLIEGCNEARDTAERAGWGAEEIDGLVAPFRPFVLTALSAYTGTEDRGILRQWTPAAQRFCLYHSFRGGELHDKYRHHFSFLRHEAGEDPVRRLAWSGEPTGPGPRVSATDNRWQLEEVPGATSALHVQTAMCRTLPTYFCSPGVIYDQDFRNMPGFWETPLAISRLPQDVHTWHMTHGGLPDAVIKATRTGTHGLVRADQMHGPDGRLVATLYSEETTGDHCAMPLAGDIEGQAFGPSGQEIWSGRASGRLSVPVFPLSYFVGRRI